MRLTKTWAGQSARGSNLSLAESFVVERAVDRGSLVEHLRTLLAAARRVRPRMVARVRAGGMHLEIRLAGGGLEATYGTRLGLPDSGEATPEVTLSLVTAADLGMAALPRWCDSSLGHGGFQRIVTDAGLRAEFPDRDGLWRVFDDALGEGVMAIDGADALPPWHAGAPFLGLVRFALKARGERLAHAATLGLGEDGILIVGDGGAGKSGTTLAGLAAGLSTAGDDYVGLGFEDGGPVARMLFRLLKQDRAGLARLAPHPVASHVGRPNWHGKLEFDPQAFFPGCFAERLRLRAVVVPRITREADAPLVEQVPPAEALRALMRSNLFQFGEPEDGLAFFARILKLPCYRMALPPDPVANGAALKRLIVEHAP